MFIQSSKVHLSSWLSELDERHLLSMSSMQRDVEVAGVISFSAAFPSPYAETSIGVNSSFLDACTRYEGNGGEASGLQSIQGLTPLDRE